jgi:hypothetical protein
MGLLIAMAWYALQIGARAQDDDDDDDDDDDGWI